MKTKFHIENKNFTEYIKIIADGKEYYFCDDLTIEHSSAEILDVDIELISNEDYLKIKAKNPLLRILLNVLKWIFAPIMYFADNYDEAGFNKGYFSFNPFTVKKSFSVFSPDGKTVNLRYKNSRYNKETHKYSPPCIEVNSEDVAVKKDEVKFSPDRLKKEWNAYHIPAFSVIMIIILFLEVVNFLIFSDAKTDGLIGVIIGLVFTALLVAFILVIVKAYRLYKQILKINEEQKTPPTPF